MTNVEDDDDKSFWSIIVFGGILIVVLMVFGIAIYYLVRCCNRSRKGGTDVKPLKGDIEMLASSSNREFIDQNGEDDAGLSKKKKKKKKKDEDPSS